MELMFNEFNMAGMVNTLSDGIIAFVCGFGGGVSKEDAFNGLGMKF